jgi:hypothetical protein
MHHFHELLLCWVTMLMVDAGLDRGAAMPLLTGSAIQKLIGPQAFFDVRLNGHRRI